MATMATQCGLYLYSGIPVVSLEGDWDDQSDALLDEIVQNLANAGHYEIILNLTRIQPSSLPERNWLEVLERLGGFLRSHFGRLNIVGNLEWVESQMRAQALSLLRWARTEEEALCRIKGVPYMTQGQRLAMRLAK